MKRRKKIRTMVTGGICLLVIAASNAGCSSKKSEGIEVQKEQTVEKLQVTEPVTDTALRSGKQPVQETEEPALSEENAGNMEKENPQAQVVVYVCGAVCHPGVYTLSGTPRMADAVEAAGGMSEQADKNVLNLAQYISDGQMIRIPAIGEVTDTKDWSGLQSSTGAGDNITASSDDSSSVSQENSDDEQADNRVDLNSADAAKLMTIPGVGQAKAEAILKYREENGRFEKVEDIMQVPGIKEGSFARMEPYICVK